MTKHEIKVEYSNSTNLKELINKAYFDEGNLGKIISKKYFLEIDEKDEVNWVIFNGLHNATAKITNEELIDGSLRFIVDESNGNVRLYPISIYCIQEDGKYIFY
jgi:hypothetical protein